MYFMIKDEHFFNKMKILGKFSNIIKAFNSELIHI